jgi:hypothetical protein
MWHPKKHSQQEELTKRQLDRCRRPLTKGVSSTPGDRDLCRCRKKPAARGCIPLWTAEGAGAVSRQIIGTAVIGGMLTASFIAIFLIPTFFYLAEKFTERKEKVESEAPAVEGVSVQPDYKSASKQ